MRANLVIIADIPWMIPKWRDPTLNRTTKPSFCLGVSMIGARLEGLWGWNLRSGSTESGKFIRRQLHYPCAKPPGKPTKKQIEQDWACVQDVLKPCTGLACRTMMTWVMPQLEMFHFSAECFPSRPLQIAADNFTSTYGTTQFHHGGPPNLVLASSF